MNPCKPAFYSVTSVIQKKIAYCGGGGRKFRVRNSSNKRRLGWREPQFILSQFCEIQETSLAWTHRNDESCYQAKQGHNFNLKYLLWAGTLTMSIKLPTSVQVSRSHKVRRKTHSFFWVTSAWQRTLKHFPAPPLAPHSPHFKDVPKELKMTHQPF